MNLAAIAIPGGFPTWATLTLGFVLGLRHALDPDHVAAVSTFISEERNLIRSSLVGVYWGMGHAAALLIFGFAILVFRFEINPHLSQFMEFSVGCMLIFLGIRALFNLEKAGGLHVHTHSHNGTSHAHLHFHLRGKRPRASAPHLAFWQTALCRRRGSWIGGDGCSIVNCRGCDSFLITCFRNYSDFWSGHHGWDDGMSVVLSVPIALAAGRWFALECTIRLLAGSFSLGFGIFWAWRIALVQAYFR